MYVKCLAQRLVRKIYFSHQEKGITINTILHPPSLCKLLKKILMWLKKTPPPPF